MSNNKFYLLCAALVLVIITFAQSFVDWLAPVDCEKERESGYIVSEQCFWE